MRGLTKRLRGLGFKIAVVAQAAFLGLKLTGVLGWSWWWVTSPAWIWAGLTVGTILALVGVVVLGVVGSALIVYDL